MKKFVLHIFSLSFLFIFVFSGFSVARAQAAAEHSNAPVCPGPASEGNARCHALVVTDSRGQPSAVTIPDGYGPLDFRTAYGLTGTVTSPTTIAIVDAYHHPFILSDLNYYSQAFGIPGLTSCPVSSGTITSPCFQQVNQNGGTKYPKTDAGWALEIALDVEAAHAACQNCNILLVEASSSSYTNLMLAVDRARLMGAKVISNSYGSGEFSGQTSLDPHFNYPGLAFVFSAGDSGYGAGYPASSEYVTAVGGTTLNKSGSTYSETVWSGTGSGCSLYEAKPSWQHDSGCANRTVADVAAVANPNTGAAIYSSVRYQGWKGWFKVGGTSLSAPLIAAVYALGGIPANSPANSLPYLATSADFHDIVIGSNGNCLTYLCTAIDGYDGPTGLGTPSGVGGF